MTYNPFGNYKSPSLTAAKTNDDGSYFKITYQSKKQATTKADSKGIDIKIFICLASLRLLELIGKMMSN